MTEPTRERVAIIATHGPDDQERATLPFMMGNAALAMDMEAVIVLQGAAVMLASRACHAHVMAGGLPTLEGQVDLFLAAGGKLLVCTPCVEYREVSADMLVGGAELIAGARVIIETTSADAVLAY